MSRIRTHGFPSRLLPRGVNSKGRVLHRVPCVTLLTETEWVELVELGWNPVEPPSDAAVVARELAEAIGISGEEAEPYGTGDRAKRIADILKTCAS